MRTFLISATIFIFVVILIIFFQNLSNTVYGLWILFYQFSQKDSASMAVLVVSALGFIAGVMSTLLLTSIISMNKDEEAPGGSNW